MIDVEIFFAVERPLHPVFGKTSNIAAYPHWMPDKRGFSQSFKNTRANPT
jgi:hypothetical protein